MKYMKLDYIKLHSRIDYNDEDALLTLYTDAAEQTVMNYIGRTYEEMMVEWGHVPEPIRQATLILVDMSYQHRSTVSQQEMKGNPAFSLLTKPYMRLSDDGNARYSEVVLGSQIKIAFTACLPDGLQLADVDFSIVVFNSSDSEKAVSASKKDCIQVSKNDYVVMVDSDDIGIGLVRMKLTLHIPDTDYPDGYRKEVVNINPRISIKG